MILLFIAYKLHKFYCKSEDLTSVDVHHDEIHGRTEDDVYTNIVDIDSPDDDLFSRSDTNTEGNIFVPKSVLRAEYGLLYEDVGLLYQGLQRNYLVVGVPLPNLKGITDIEPHFGLNCKFPGLDRTPLVHDKLCKIFKMRYFFASMRLSRMRRLIARKLREDLPAILPNKRFLQFTEQKRANNKESGRHPRDVKRFKRLALATIFSGISAIGGLVYEGINTLINYKKTKSMAKGMEVLFKQTELNNQQILAIRSDFIHVTKAIQKDFQDVKNSLNSNTQRIGNLEGDFHDFTKDIYKHLKSAHKFINDNSAAILLSARLSSIYHRELASRIQLYQHYLTVIDSFIAGIASLSTGRLSYDVITPQTLQNLLLRVIEHVQRTNPTWEPAFDHLYQYYGQPLVTFTNTHEMLIIQIPIFFKNTHYAPMPLYRLHTVPVPLDEDTMLEKESKYTLLNFGMSYAAIDENAHITLSKHSLDRCTHIAATYYCETLHYRGHTSEHSCASAIFYFADSKEILAKCDFVYFHQHDPRPQILDSQEYLLLSNVPKPWHLLCDKDLKRPLPFEGANYAIIKREDLCYCGISAGDFFLHEVMAQCDKTEIGIQMYFVRNKAVFDFQKVLGKDTKVDASKLLVDVPHYTCTDMQLYVPKSDNYMLQDTADEPLHMSTALQAMETNKEFYLNQQAYDDNKPLFFKTMRKLAFFRIAHILWFLMFVLLIAVGICLYIRRKKVLAYITGLSAVQSSPLGPMLKNVSAFQYQAVTMTSDIARATPPTFLEALGHAFLFYTWVLALSCVLAFLLYLILRFVYYCIQRYNLCQTLWPWFMMKGRTGNAYATDILLEITDVTKHMTILAKFMTIKAFPHAITFRGSLTMEDVEIIKSRCCYHTLRVNWSGLTLFHGQDHLTIPPIGFIYVFQPNILNDLYAPGPFRMKLWLRYLGVLVPIENYDRVYTTIDSLYEELVSGRPTGLAETVPVETPVRAQHATLCTAAEPKIRTEIV